MLQVPDLDNITYEQLLENAIHKIPQLTKEWTDFNVHDPGITTLEIHAWLIDMLNYYINASGDVHTYKYMKLLGITPQRSSAAGVYAAMEPGEADVQVIPKDFPVYAGNKCFVTAGEKKIYRNRLLGVYRQLDERVIDLTDFAGRNGSFACVFDPESGCEEAVLLKFEKTLEETAELFVTVRERENCEQLPEDFCLSVLKAQYFDGTDWKDAEILQDGTHGLLTSGILQLSLDGKMCESAMLKLVLEENCFDTAPEIGEIYLNPVAMIQKENLLRRLEYVIPSGEKEIVLKEYLAGDETVRAGVQDAASEQWIVPVSGYRLDRAENKIVFEEGVLPEQECRIDVFVIRDSVAGQIDIGITDGCADQEYELFAAMPYETELLIGKETEEGFQYSKWTCIDELEKASGRDLVYTWDEAAGVIRFGDGIHGMVPEEGSLIRLSTLSVSVFEEGNVRAGEISLIQDDRYAAVAVNNFEAASGGRNTETLEEMQKRMEAQVLTQNRLVSPSDYEDMVKKVPGLRIKAAKAIPAAQYCSSHGLTALPYDIWLVVCPESRSRRRQLSPQYETAILRWLEPCRMLGTRIRVTAPSYTGIQISGKLRINTEKQRAGEEIRRFLSEYIGQYEKECSFGAVISQADLFMRLENLECVERVDELHLSPGGKHAVRNDRGDVIMAEDCLPYAGEIAFELNSNFG